MKPAVYLESSIISYLTGRPSRDVITLALQQLTLDWWATRRHEFRLVASELVVKEVAAWDPSVAQLRLDLLKDIPLLDVSEQAIQLSIVLAREAGLPTSCRRLSAYRNRGLPRRGIPSDLELQTHRERGIPPPSGAELPEGWIRAAGALYAGRIDGRRRSCWSQLSPKESGRIRLLRKCVQRENVSLRRRATA
jgi:hypothetical protein